MVRVNLPSLLGAVALTGLSLVGCYEGKDGTHYLSEKSRQEADIRYSEEKAKPKDYFAENLTYNNLDGVAITSGDFDKDGDLDLVVFTANGGRLYFFEGNGHGGFKLRDYSE